MARSSSSQFCMSSPKSIFVIERNLDWDFVAASSPHHPPLQIHLHPHPSFNFSLPPTIPSSHQTPNPTPNPPQPQQISRSPKTRTHRQNLRRSCALNSIQEITPGIQCEHHISPSLPITFHSTHVDPGSPLSQHPKQSHPKPTRKEVKSCSYPSET